MPIPNPANPIPTGPPNDTALPKIPILLRTNPDNAPIPNPFNPPFIK